MNKNNVKSKKYKILVGILLVLTLASLAFAVISYISRMNEEEKKETTNSGAVTYTEEEVNSLIEKAKLNSDNAFLSTLKDKFSSGSSTSAILKKLYPENVIYYDTDRYVFAPILNNVTKHNLSYSGFAVAEDGRITYSDNNQVKSYMGIDVSKFQGNIDWSKVKKAGVDFTMIRCGFRSYGNGIMNDDSNFKQNVSGASAAGLSVGVYYFSSAITVAEAVEEADYVISAIKPYKINYPVVIDLEEIANDTYRQESLSAKELTDICIAFCDRIKSAGYTPMVYSNLKGFIGNLDLERINQYEKWFAYYDTELYFPYQLSMWQYSSSGKIDGITGNVDLNISFKNWN